MFNVHIKIKFIVTKKKLGKTIDKYCVAIILNVFVILSMTRYDNKNIG